MPWRRKWLVTPVSLLGYSSILVHGEFHGQRCLVGYSLWGHKELNMTEQLMLSLSLWREVKVAQLCPILCNPMNCIVPGILWARILEWAAFPFSRGSSQPRDQTQVSCIAGGFLISWATREAQEYWSGSLFFLQWIFLTQELNHGLLHYRQILYQLSYEGSP